MRIFPTDSDEDDAARQSAAAQERALARSSTAPFRSSSRLLLRHVAAARAARLRSHARLCAAVDATYDEMRAFRLSGRIVSPGRPFMGWEDARAVEGTSVKFQLRKHFAAASSASELSDKTWAWLSEPEPVLRRFNALARVETLERVNEDLLVALHDAETPTGHSIRCVYMVCRMRTPRGFIICVRSMPPDTPVAAANGDDDEDGGAVLHANVFGWFRFDDAAPASARVGDSSDSETSDDYSGDCSSSSNSVDDGRGGRSDRDGRLGSGNTRRQLAGVHVECAGRLDLGDASPLSSAAMSSLWLALQWESVVVAPLFRLNTPL